MMTPRPAPGYVRAIIRLVQGRDDAIAAVALLSAIALFAMMAIRILVAWQTGLL